MRKMKKCYFQLYTKANITINKKMLKMKLENKVDNHVVLK